MPNTLLDDETGAPYNGVKSSCLACGGVTRAGGDMLCAACWPKIGREAKAAWRQVWTGVRFGNLPQSSLDTATATLVAVARGEITEEAPVPDEAPTRKEVERACSQCTTMFTFTPGIGRPPLRCRECRGLARYDITPAAPKPAVARVVTEKPGKVRPVSPVDYRALHQQLVDEIAVLERHIELRARVRDALQPFLEDSLTPSPSCRDGAER